MGNSFDPTLVPSPAVKYFQELSHSKTMQEQLAASQQQSLREQIRLAIQLTEADPSYTYSLRIIDNTDNMSKQLCNTSPESPTADKKLIFQANILMEYWFEKDQPLTFIFGKTKSGAKTEINFKTSVGAIVGSRQSTLTKQIGEDYQEKVVVTATEIKNESESLIIDFDVSQLGKGFDWTKKKNKLFYLIENKTRIYKSETIADDGKFAPAKIPSGLLKPSFKFSIVSVKPKVLFEQTYTVEDFTSPNGPARTITVNTKKGCVSLVNKSKINKIFTFMDYLKVGVQLGLTVAIDFTGSNGDPRDEISLHRMKEGFSNDYEKAILSCGSIIAYYDYDQYFPVYGFGAIVPGQQEVNMCFNVNMQPDPNVYTIDGVIGAYHNIVTQLNFSGPTFFAPILKATIDTIKAEMNSMKYHILMILTDGIINDMSNTIDLLCIGACLPLSVIIIGIGNADFTNMDILDADDNPLVSSNGETCKRDLVQFVPFSQYQNNPKKLAEMVLEEIPRQIVEFYDMQKIYPDSIS